jgi:hypothetical protein
LGVTMWARALRWAAAVVVLSLAGCGKPANPKIDAIATDRASAICAAVDTAAEIKNLVFEQAAKQTAASNRLALAQLAKQATLRIEAPLLDSYDDDTRKTTCSGHMHVALPPGAVRNLGDTSDLTAMVKYTAQPTSDHLSTTYQVSGAEDLISGIAGADISDWAAHLQPNGMPAEGAPVPAMVRTAPAAGAPPALPANSGIRLAPGTPQPAGPARQAVASAPSPPPGPAGQFPQMPRCQWAHTYADRMICSDPALEAEDRRIAALYRRALAADSTGEVRRVAQSERAQREGCQDRDCILEWFKQREADLSSE